MFGKKETSNLPASVTSTNLGSTSSSNSVRNVDTIISANCVVDGNVRTTQSLKVDGRIEGNVQADGLIIVGTEGQVHGDINSAQLLVLGQLHGNVKVGSLHLQSTARIHGNIEAEVLQIDPGAQYQGTVTARSRNSDAAPSLKESLEQATGKKVLKDAVGGSAVPSGHPIKNG